MKLLSIDIGGTSIKYAVFNLEGEIVSDVRKKPTLIKNQTHLIIETLDEIIEEVKSVHDIEGVAVSTAGVVDTVSGEVIYSGPTIPDYSHTPIAALIKAKHGLPCVVENDVNCAALGEYWLGGGIGSKSLVLVTLGTGLGGAIVLNGQLWTGSTFSAGEIGYLPIGDKYLQEVSSTSTLISNYNKNNLSGTLNGKVIFDRAKLGEDKAIEAIHSILGPLTEGLLSIIYMLSPDTILIGGGISEQKDYLEPRIVKLVNQKIISPRFLPKHIECAKLGNKAGLYGAVFNYKKSYHLN